MEEMRTNVLGVLNKIRPYIERDGGNIELDKIEDGIVYVKMGGACEGCFAIDITLKQGIEKLLLENVPGIIGVVNL